MYIRGSYGMYAAEAAACDASSSSLLSSDASLLLPVCDRGRSASGRQLVRIQKARSTSDDAKTVSSVDTAEAACASRMKVFWASDLSTVTCFVSLGLSEGA